MPGLGASFGRGAATTYQQDLANSNAILIMGSNMAEAHPVAFRFPMQAKLKGGKLIHVDPRFTRTSALADVHVQIRAGSDIAFLGALIHYVLENDRWFKEYVMAYTNASSIIQEGFLGPEDLDGLFSGFNKDEHIYEPGKGHWGYQGAPSEKNPEIIARPEEVQQHDTGHSGHGIHGPGLMGGASEHSSKRSGLTKEPGGQPPRDETLQHPLCVMNILRKHFSRYTPENAAKICGCTPEQIIKVAETLCENSGRVKTSAICYAVGWTQHTTGVQIIRAAGILQLLLGNMGRPGGGIMALRGHSSIQGSTDIPTLYDMLPGYLTQPAADDKHEKLDTYVETEFLPTGYWANYKKFVVSLMKAWYGAEATRHNDYRFRWIPRIDGDYSQIPFFVRMTEGKVKGYFVFGQNPAAGGPNAKLHRAGLRKLEWLVCMDWFDTETSSFWKNDPDAPNPRDIPTEVFLFPAAPAPCKEGTLTNTQRLIQWHDKALDPEGDARSDLWFLYNLGKRLKRMYATSDKPQDQAIKHLTWNYDYDKRPRLPDGSYTRIVGEPDASKILQEVNGYHVDKKDEKNGKPKLLSGFSDLKDDGSTACGCWIYSGIFPEYDHNRARDRILTDNPVQPDWAYAWPHNRRIMYNRASADPQGNPWSEEKKYLWWDREKKKWVGLDTPDFEPEKPPDYQPGPHDKAMDAISGSSPFIMKPDGRAWLFSPGGAKDGPLPTHYEPVESPLSNLLYPKQEDNPTTRYFEGPLNPIAHTPTDDYPVVACTFRLTEHYLSGPMSRFNSWLNELQPAMFVELSPELAIEKGIVHGEWMTVISPRGKIEAMAMVTRRLKPFALEGKVVHQIGLPFHWGYAGETTGAITNDLTSAAVGPNVTMHEGKVFACQVRAGRIADEPQANKQSKIVGNTSAATVQPAPWPTRQPTPNTPPSAQPEGHLT